MAKKDSAVLVFDDQMLRLLILDETTEHTSTATEHNVEIGADITDHVRNEADRITLKAIISNTPVKDENSFYGMQVAGLELKVPKAETKVALMPGAALNAGLDALANAINPPDPWKAVVLQFPEKFDAVKNEMAMLFDWKERAVLGKVITAWREYNNTVITHIAVGRSEPMGGVEVTIELRTIRLVEVGSATLPIPEEVRGKVKINKGHQPTTEIPDGPRKSTLKAGIDLRRGR